MNVLNVHTLNQDQLRSLIRNYEKLKSEELDLFKNLQHDHTRKAIDEAFQKALGWPDISPLREQFEKDPIIINEPLARLSYPDKELIKNLDTWL